MKPIIFVLVFLLGVFAAEAIPFEDGMLKLSWHYIAIQKLLSADTIKGIDALADSMYVTIQSMQDSQPEDADYSHTASMKTTVQNGVVLLRASKTLKEYRDAFNALSKPLALWISLRKPPGVYVVYCPMAKASWLQDSEEVANPYYGNSMLRCGEIVSQPEVTE